MADKGRVMHLTGSERAEREHLLGRRLEEAGRPDLVYVPDEVAVAIPGVPPLREQRFDPATVATMKAAPISGGDGDIAGALGATPHPADADASVSGAEVPPAASGDASGRSASRKRRA